MMSIKQEIFVDVCESLSAPPAARCIALPQLESAYNIGLARNLALFYSLGTFLYLDKYSTRYGWIIIARTVQMRNTKTKS